MSKLTLSFKGRLLSIYHLEDAQPVTVGRDTDCQLCIDSLAIAPRHAELMPTDTGWLLLSLDPGFPVLLNDAQVDQASLHHGDTIQLGKHTLSFSEDTLELGPIPPREEPTATREETGSQNAEVAEEAVPAYLQVQSGPQIGRVIVLRRSVTRLSRLGIEDVIVTRHGDTYRLARLGRKQRVKINEESMDADDATLTNNGTIEIGPVRLRFFLAEPEGTQYNPAA
jgi:pSer/pThr/pTyr-binding forkhead associated (FHA) protein